MPKRPSSPPPLSLNKRQKKTLPPVPSPSADPLSIDYRANPHLYKILRGEMNVFKTNPYSAEIKGLWRFKDEAIARESVRGIWGKFEEFRSKKDFVGMDVSRKFLQMGYTRSTRYALRPSGRKYPAGPEGSKGSLGSKGTQRIAMPRTGQIYDQEKYRGAQVFWDAWKRVEGDEVYRAMRGGWGRVGKGGGEGKGKGKGKGGKEEEEREEEEREEVKHEEVKKVKKEDEEERDLKPHIPSPPPHPTRQTRTSKNQSKNQSENSTRIKKEN